jgi:hypothetical protein
MILTNEMCVVPFLRNGRWLSRSMRSLGNVAIKAKQDVPTSDQRTGHSFTMQDDLNIIRKFCGGG